MKHIHLVVGGAGFIGSALTRLLSADNQVRVLDDLSTGHAKNLEGVGAELVVGSLLDAEAVDRALTDVGTVYHLACRGVRHSIAKPYENHRVNAEGTLGLLEAARRAEVDRFVYTSTSEVYGTAIHVPMDEEHPAWPHTVYGGSKLAGEAYARAYHRTYGLPTVVVRPFNAYGPRSHHEGDSGEVIPKFLLRAMNDLPPVIFGDGSQTRDFTYVEDSARGILAAGRSREAVGETINLGSGMEITVTELAGLVARAVGRSDFEPEFQDARPGDVMRLLSDSSKAERLLEWYPRVALDEGLELLLHWHREQGTDWELALSEDQTRNWERAQA